jgi:hypothetical protein
LACSRSLVHFLLLLLLLPILFVCFLCSSSTHARYDDGASHKGERRRRRRTPCGQAGFCFFSWDYSETAHSQQESPAELRHNSSSSSSNTTDYKRS